MEVDSDDSGSIDDLTNQFTKRSLLTNSTNQYHSKPSKKLAYKALIDIDWG